MKSDEIRKQIELLEAQLAALPQVTDAELSAQVSAGGDAAQLVEQAAETDKRRRTLAIQVDSLQRQLTAAVKSEARPAIDAALKTRQAAIDKAAKALGDSGAAIDVFKRAIEQWEDAAAAAAEAGRQANATARQAGVTPPVPEFQVSLGSGEFYLMDKRIATILAKHRRDGSQLNKQQVEPLEVY